MIVRALIVGGVLLASGCAGILGLDHNDGQGGDGGTSDAGQHRADGNGGTHPDVRMISHVDGGGTSGDATMVHPHDGDIPPTDGARPAVDAGSGGKDSGPPPPCTKGFCACMAADAQFCADFDESNPLKGLTISLDAGDFTEAGIVSVVDAEALSPPRSLRSQIPQNGFGSAAVVTHEMAADGSRYDLSCELLIDNCTLFSSLTDRVVGIGVTTAVTATLSLIQGDAGPALVAGQDNSYSEYYLYLTPGAWTPVHAVVDSQAHTFAVTVGTRQFQFPIQLFGDAGPLAMASFSLGQLATPSPACEVYIDNVTFNVLP